MQRFFLSIIMAIFSLSLMSCVSSQQNTKKGTVDSDGMVLVPKGLFTMGLQEDELNEQPEHEVYLDSYKIDRDEVSAKDFAAFLNARGNPENRYFTAVASSTVVVEETVLPADTAKQSRLSYVAKQGYENFPANNVSWFGAEEYCRWKGRRLPTEAEWEKAAR